MRKPKATAAELRNKARMSMPCVCEDYCRCDVTTVVDDDALDEILAAARAEAVAPVMDVLRALVEAGPRCSNCGAIAVSLSCDGYNDHCYGCDECGGIPEMPQAPQIRLALALLAADQEGK